VKREKIFTDRETEKFFPLIVKREKFYKLGKTTSGAKTFSVANTQQLQLSKIYINEYICDGLLFTKLDDENMILAQESKFPKNLVTPTALGAGQPVVYAEDTNNTDYK
jgi:hypothetical protein